MIYIGWRANLISIAFGLVVDTFGLGLVCSVHDCFLVLDRLHLHTRNINTSTPGALVHAPVCP